MTNPFEDTSGQYQALVNDEGQYSLWPAFHDIPVGWIAVGSVCSRSECLDWITDNWIDMRPNSLVDSTSKETILSSNA